MHFLWLKLIQFKLFIEDENNSYLQGEFRVKFAYPYYKMLHLLEYTAFL
jgi:hypothetical protein